MNKYIGITIGPVIRTLGMAKKPRELWSASYLFSYLMKSLVTTKPKETELLSPAFENDNALSSVGVYPDRLYLKIQESITFDQIKTWIENTIKQISKDLKINQDYLNDYFKIYAVDVDSETDSNAIKKLNNRLDVSELEYKAMSKESQGQLVLDLVKTKFNSPLFTIALGQPKFSVETLAEIASNELLKIDTEQYNKYFEEDEENLIKNLKKGFGDKFKSYHKYICIVHADGDNVGQLVTALNDGEHTKFSADLMNFGKKASEKIEEYGGLPIYAGGDDLLFIAPVVSIDENTKKQHIIFDLLDQISNVFNTSLFVEKKLKYDTFEKVSLPSLSFGLTISYYKYPLYESLEKSRNNLFEVAKKHSNEIKNSIAWSMQKNSGSTVTSVLSLTNDSLFEAFKKIIEETKDEQLVSAVAQKIRNSKELFCLFENSYILEVRILSYFKTYLEYKEEKPGESDQTKNKRLYLEAVKTLLIELFKLNLDAENIVNQCYSILRTAKFIKGMEDDHE